MKKSFYSAKTLDEALQQAAQEFKIEVDFIRYNILPESTKRGLLARLFSRQVNIEAWVDHNSASSAQDLEAAAWAVVSQTLAAEARKKNAKHGLHSDSSQVVSLKKNTLSQGQQSVTLPQSVPVDDVFLKHMDAVLTDWSQSLCIHFGLQSHEFTIHADHDQRPDGSPLVHYTVYFKDPFFEATLIHSNKMALAFEHIAKRMAQHKWSGGERVFLPLGRVLMRAGHSAEQCNDKLVQMALQMAQKVRQSGRSEVALARNSQERKIVHQALSGVAGVVTKSMGSGLQRRLVIYPADASHVGSLDLEPVQPRGPARKRNHDGSRFSSGPRAASGTTNGRRMGKSKYKSKAT